MIRYYDWNQKVPYEFQYLIGKSHFFIGLYKGNTYYRSDYLMINRCSATNILTKEVFTEGYNMNSIFIENHMQFAFYRKRDENV